MSATQTTSDIRPELLSLKGKLSAEIDNDKKEIEFRKRRLVKNEALLAALNASLSVSAHSTAPKSNTYGDKVQIVRNAIKNLPNDQFKMADVENQLETEFEEVPRTKVRNVLWNLANKSGELKTIKKGNNKEPAIYERVTERTLFNTNGVHK